MELISRERARGSQLPLHTSGKEPTPTNPYGHARPQMVLRLALLLLSLQRATAAAAVAGAPAPARILPLGDSLTLGVQGQGGGYRSPLGQALKGYNTPYNAGFVGGLYLAGDHSGYSGHTIAGILSSVTAARTMEINEPTHVLLLGGTNDFYFYPPLGADAATALQRMDLLLGFLTNRTAAPQIFLATVPPVLAQRCAVYSQGPCAPTIAQNIADYNQQLPALVKRWTGKGAKLQLVDMGAAEFEEEDYWVAGIHFNDNGWCKMAKVWAQHLLPTLPKRDAAQLDGAGGMGEVEEAAASLFMDPVPPSARCVIPGSTTTTRSSSTTTRNAAAAYAAASLLPQAAASRRGETGRETGKEIRKETGEETRKETGEEAAAGTCAIVVTVNVHGTPPAFGDFYGNVSRALNLQYGRGGAFCAWTGLQPVSDTMEMAPWMQHGVVDAWQTVPAPAGPAFSVLQSLGSQLLETTVSTAATSTSTTAASATSTPGAPNVGLALGTMRRWATQTTISAVLNVTGGGGGGACLEIVGLSPSVVERQCGTGGQAAATAVELVYKAGVASTSTVTRAVPCAVGAAPGIVRLALGSSEGGTLSAVTFTTSHL